MVIGRDGKTVVVKHSGLLRNVTKIHITRIQGFTEDKTEGRDKENEENTDLRGENDTNKENG